MTQTFSFRPGLEQVYLPVLVTGDLHAALLSYDYFTDRPRMGGALTRLASLIEAERQAGTRPLLLDNGDFLQGTPIGEMWADSTGKHAGPGAGVHPVIRAMNHLGYDAAALGNHEFNLDRDDLRAALGAARFPLLCANLAPVEGPKGQEFAGLWRRGVVLSHETRDGAGRAVTVRVGVLGVLPPQVTQWDRMRIGGRLEAGDIVEAARATARELRDTGADIVVALAHTGIVAEDYAPGMENAALQVAAIEEIDAIACGHIHKVFPGPGHPAHPAIDADRGRLHGTAAVMPGASGSHLGRLDLLLAPEGGGWRVAESRAGVVPSSDVAEEAGLLDALAGDHARTLAAVRTEIGRLAAPVDSYFALIGDDRSARIVAEAKLAWAREALVDTEWAGLPVLASVAPMKCGGRAGGGHYVDIPAGPVAVRTVADLQVYPNHLSALVMTGAGIVEWLERSASLYDRLVPGGGRQRLIDRDAPSYDREAIYGLSYEIDLSQPARYDARGRIVDAEARRVCQLRFRGREVRPDAVFLLLSNDYRVGGGGAYPGTGEGAHVAAVAPMPVRTILRDFIAGGGADRTGDVPSWRFRALEGVEAAFETGTGALGVGWPPGVRALGETDAGFHRFVLDMGGTLASGQDRGYIAR